MFRPIMILSRRLLLLAVVLHAGALAQAAMPLPDEYRITLVIR